MLDLVILKSRGVRLKHVAWQHDSTFQWELHALALLNLNISSGWECVLPRIRTI